MFQADIVITISATVITSPQRRDWALKVTNRSGPPLHSGGRIGSEGTAAVVEGELEREERGDGPREDVRLSPWFESVIVLVREEELEVMKSESGGMS